MDQLTIMRSFVGVTKSRSFSQAARSLGISGSLVSRQPTEWVVLGGEVDARAEPDPGGHRRRGTQRHERVVEARVLVGPARAHVESPGVQGAVDDAAAKVAERERAVRVRARVLDGVHLRALAEQGDGLAFELDEVAPAVGEVRAPADRSRSAGPGHVRTSRPPRPRSGPVGQPAGSGRSSP